MSNQDIGGVFNRDDRGEFGDGMVEKILRVLGIDVEKAKQTAPGLQKYANAAEKARPHIAKALEIFAKELA